MPGDHRISLVGGEPVDVSTNITQNQLQHTFNIIDQNVRDRRSQHQLSEHHSRQIQSPDVQLSQLKELQNYFVRDNSAPFKGL